MKLTQITIDRYRLWVHVPSKIMESCLSESVVQHVFDNNLVLNSGRKVRSTLQNYCSYWHLSEIWRASIDANKVVAIAFADFRKVLTVSPTVMADRLPNGSNSILGSEQPALNLLAGFLKGQYLAQRCCSCTQMTNQLQLLLALSLCERMTPPFIALGIRLITLSSVPSTSFPGISNFVTITLIAP